MLFKVLNCPGVQHSMRYKVVKVSSTGNKLHETGRTLHNEDAARTKTIHITHDLSQRQSKPVLHNCGLAEEVLPHIASQTGWEGQCCLLNDIWGSLLLYIAMLTRQKDLGAV